MGLNANGTDFLLYAKSEGVDFTDTLMIGRQRIYVSVAEMTQLLAAYGHSVEEANAQALANGRDGYGEPLLEFLGARCAHSLDFSNYEHPTFTHDMNQPVPATHKAKYSVVLDGGSLEHVFNFPIAIKNCMEMVRLNGHYLGITPANNFFGHGFYQFSPELYFNVLSESNGFRVQQMFAFEDVSNPTWHRVANPREVGGRVTLCNELPVYLLVIAKKVSDVPIFASYPQQSDYTTIWNKTSSPPSAPFASNAPALPRPALIRLAKLVLPQRVRFFLRETFNPPRPPKTEMGFVKKFFTPFPHRGN